MAMPHRELACESAAGLIEAAEVMDHYADMLEGGPDDRPLGTVRRRVLASAIATLCRLSLIPVRTDASKSDG